MTGQLEHPSIVPVYELGVRTDGRLYYTMKLVRGGTLADSISACERMEDRLGLLRPFLDVCQAMAYAHHRGVIHRDLKPSNIMVGEFGECVVLDWGLAKLRGDRDAHREALEDTAQKISLSVDELSGTETEESEVLGTPLYMAPEQARSEHDAVGERSDVYALGTVLYEILTGELPHPWTNTRDTTARVGSTPAPSIRLRAPYIPPELAAICDKALSFDAQHRYPTAQELSKDLRDFLEGALVGAYAYRLPDKLRRIYREHRALINSAAVAALTVIGIGVISYINIYNARQAEQSARIVAEQEREKAETQRAEAEAQRNLAVTQRTRAETAEEQTAREKYASDIHLAAAYIREYKFAVAEQTLLATDARLRNFEWANLVAQCHQDLVTLERHDRPVFSQLSHEGNYILTLSGDGSANLWDSGSDTALHTWSFEDRQIQNALFSPDDRRIAVWFSDGTITLLDCQTGATTLSWKAHPTRVNMCAFSPSGEQLFSCGSDHKMRSWDMVTTTPALEIDTGENAVVQIHLSDDGSTLLTASANGLIKQYDATTGTEGIEAQAQGRIADSAANLIAVMGGTAVSILNNDDLSIRHHLEHDTPVSRARLYEDGKTLITAARDGIVRQWNMESGTLGRLYNFKKPVDNVRLSDDGANIVATALDGDIQIWDRSNGVEIHRFGGHRDSLITMDLDQGGAFVLTSSRDGSTKKWNLDQRWTTKTIHDANAPLAFTTITDDRETLALVTMDGTVNVLRTEDGAIIYQANIAPVSLGERLALSPDGKRIALVLDDFLAIVVALEDGRVVSELHGHEGVIRGIHFSPDGTEVVTASWDQSACVWDAESGTLTKRLTGHSAAVNRALFSPNGQLIATASLDATTRLWDYETATTVLSIPLSDKANIFAFSPNSERIATASRNGRVALWDIASQQEIRTLDTGDARLASMAFSPDGARLLTVTDSGGVYLWDLKTGVLLDTLTGSPSDFSQWATFDRHGAAILTASPLGVIRRYHPAPQTLLARDIDASELDSEMADFKRDQLARRFIAPSPDPDLAHHQYLPREGVLQLAQFLFSAASEGGQVPELDHGRGAFPMDLQAGDVVATINGSPLEDYIAGNPIDSVVQQISDGERLEFTVARSGSTIPMSVVAIAERRTDRQVELSVDEASNLLAECRKLLESDGDTIAETSRSYGIRMHLPTITTAPDQVPGLWIGFPRASDGSIALSGFGLQSGEFLDRIGEEAIRSLNQLAALISSGEAFLASNGSIETVIQLKRGQFETVTLTFKSLTGN